MNNVYNGSGNLGKSQGNKLCVQFHTYLVRQNVEFSLLLVKETGRNLSVMFIFLAQADSFLACKSGTPKLHS